jgi:hypothetical protein
MAPECQVSHGRNKLWLWNKTAGQQLPSENWFFYLLVQLTSGKKFQFILQKESFYRTERKPSENLFLAKLPNFILVI